MTNGSEMKKPPRDLDGLLREVMAQEVPGGQRIRERVLAEGRPVSAEIMTLAEVAAFLRISEVELGEIADSLPAFELANQILVRKSRLLEWIEEREGHYAWSAAHSRESCQRHLSIGKGVA